eukprot:gene14646-biopygen5135
MRSGSLAFQRLSRDTSFPGKCTCRVELNCTEVVWLSLSRADSGCNELVRTEENRSPHGADTIWTKRHKPKCPEAVSHNCTQTTERSTSSELIPPTTPPIRRESSDHPATPLNAPHHASAELESVQ